MSLTLNELKSLFDQGLLLVNHPDPIAGARVEKGKCRSDLPYFRSLGAICNWEKHMRVWQGLRGALPMEKHGLTHDLCLIKRLS